MASETAATLTRSEAAERAALRTLAARRRRVWRNTVIFVLITAGMVLLSMASRDDQSIQTCRQNLQYAVDVFKRDFAGRALPWTFPQPREDTAVVRDHFRYSPDNMNQLGTIRPVAVCCCDRTHGLFLHKNGRHVLLFDGRDFEIRWMTEDEFRTQAVKLGIHARPQPQTQR